MKAEPAINIPEQVDNINKAEEALPRQVAFEAHAETEENLLDTVGEVALEAHAETEENPLDTVGEVALEATEKPIVLHVAAGEEAIAAFEPEQAEEVVVAQELELMTIPTIFVIPPQGEDSWGVHANETGSLDYSVVRY